MDEPSPPQFEFDADADPALQSLLAELDQDVQSTETEVAAELPQLEMEEAAREQELKQAAEAEPQLEPQAAEQELEQSYAAWTGSTQEAPGGWEPSLVPGLASAARGILDRVADRPPPLPSAEPQWHYAEAGKSHGPVPQSSLVGLLAEGRLPWTALVWNKTLRDWTPASQTELRDEITRTPPPLPDAVGPPLTTEAAVACSACGKEAQPGDRFCAGCGAKLPS